MTRSSLIFFLLAIHSVLYAQQLSGNVTTAHTDPTGSTNTTSDDTTTSPTTTKPTTTTSTVTTVSPLTTISPKPTVPSYVVKNGSSICLMVQLNMKLSIRYFNQKGIENTRDFFLNSSSPIVPSSSGSCEKEVEKLNLKWVPDEKQPAWTFSMHFTTLDSSNFALSHIGLDYTLTDKLFPDTNDTSTYSVVYDENVFKCSIGSFYQCMTKQTTELKSKKQITVTQPAVLVLIANMKAQAFRTGDSPLFIGTMFECSADYVPNKVVPIIVGVALAVMIVIALITFVVGSRRRQAGYHEI